jgi:mannose-1-phosphate guanylyltransferase
MPTVYATVMAGGRGERFWPLSTANVPKPFIPLPGPATLIQDTVQRLKGLVSEENVLISISEAHLNIARAQLPQIPPENFIVEPVGRDTAACLGFCALHIERRDPDAVMLALPSDHFVGNAEQYRNTLRKGFENLEGAAGVVFGITPSRAETGYGYILAEKPAIPADAWPVIRFVEKPDAATASGYLKSGNYFWNSGMFLWRNRKLLALFEEHMPETYRDLNRLRSLLGVEEKRAETLQIFSSLPRISVDFGILEKTAGLRLVPAKFIWDDIGNWAALERALPANTSGNISVGSHVALESGGCIVYSDAGSIGTFGVSDLIIVQANGKVLVCSKDRASDLKRLVTALGTEPR